MVSRTYHDQKARPKIRTKEEIRFVNPNLNQNDELKSLVLGFRLTLDARNNDQFFFDPRHKILLLKNRLHGLQIHERNRARE